MPDFEVPKRFWSKVDVGELDECWEWLAGKSAGGYGKFSIHYETWMAHRVVWILTYGPIPEGLCVCHHCDNKSCCNPYHLFLGTRGDNNRDAMRKGRKSKKLTEDDVREIREIYADNTQTQQDIADEFDVRVSQINKILRGRQWFWLK